MESWPKLTLSGYVSRALGFHFVTPRKVIEKNVALNFGHDCIHRPFSTTKVKSNNITQHCILLILPHATICRYLVHSVFVTFAYLLGQLPSASCYLHNSSSGMKYVFNETVNVINLVFGMKFRFIFQCPGSLKWFFLISLL